MRSHIKRLIDEVDSQSVGIEMERTNEKKKKVAKKDENLYEVKIIAVDTE